MSYPDSVRFLYALGNELKAGAKWGLERMLALLHALGNPEQELRIIHVAGTNGKGSTCAMIAAACRAAGLRTGLFTSPHLVSPTERIRINGEDVPEERFAALFQGVHKTAEAMVEAGEMDAHPSYFETVTAMALLAFRGTTDVVILEVGLGGRLDATNVVEPQLTVITPVDYDHEAFLGNTLSSIAAEKAGILKPQIPLVLAPQREEAERVIRERAKELGCPVIPAAEDPPAAVELTAYGSQFTFEGRTFSCPLPGEHQVENAVTAILACKAFGLSFEHIQQGVAATRWPGRLEFMERSPDLVLDGAHNPAGARALAAYIETFWAGRPVWLVYGAMRDKAIEEVTSQLFPLADKLILTAPDFARALRPEALEQMANHPNPVTAPTISAAITMAREAPREAGVFFTGSLFVVGEARALLLRK
jgi:dihydrofolate synthase / folylpolyglutamate synthase